MTTRTLVIPFATLLALVACDTDIEADPLDGTTTVVVDGGTDDPTDDTGWVAPAPELTGTFIDSVVSGLEWDSSGFVGLTDGNGTFAYDEGRTITFLISGLELGKAVGASALTPLDLFPGSDTDDEEVINVARVLQTMDRNNEHSDGIDLSPEASDLMAQVVSDLGYDAFDFTESGEIDEILSLFVKRAEALPDHSIAEVDATDARDALVAALEEGSLFRKNITKTAAMRSDKQLVSVMSVYTPALKADGSTTTIEIYDADGLLVETRDDAHPILVSYLQELDIRASGVFPENEPLDAHIALSLDSGNSWKRKNISKMADDSSFTSRDGTVWFGVNSRVVHATEGDHIMVAWQSKYCKGGQPAYTLEEESDYWTDDIWGVAGSQGSHDYTDEGFPEVGEVPYSCIWTTRGLIDTDTGEVTWYKPERLTSGARDANLPCLKGVEDVGFTLTWQEDPMGIRPGDGEGPGEGWSGATANHKTDLWYSYVGWDDFGLVDTEDEGTTDGDPDSDITRPRVLVPWSLPVRLTDNDTCNEDNIDSDDGAHRYCTEVTGLCDTMEVSEITGKLVCITSDGRWLDGDTATTRPSVGMLEWVGDDGEKGAWITMGYEETKGLGEGSGEDPLDSGKNVWYHTFPWDQPEVVAQGFQVNHPAVDDDFNIMYITDDIGLPTDMYDTEIARKVTLTAQMVSTLGETRTGLIFQWKQGREGRGGPADMFIRRLIVPEGIDPSVDNPYDPAYFECDEYDADGFCLAGAKNVTSTTVLEMTADTSDDTSDGDNSKVARWEQTEDNLDDQSFENPYDNFRSPRGFLDGDEFVAAYVWCPNWKAATRAHAVYDIYVRRSFDGGQSFTTDPTATDSVDVCTIQMDSAGERFEVCVTVAPGEFEPARNLTLFTSAKYTALDPRIVVTPISNDDARYDDDIQDPDTYMFVYGTGELFPESGADGDDVSEGVAEDSLYTYTLDNGQTWYTVEKEISAGSTSEYAGETVDVHDWLAQGAGPQEEPEASTLPNGSVLYGVYHQTPPEEDDARGNSSSRRNDGDDLWFRKVWAK